VGSYRRRGYRNAYHGVSQRRELTSTFGGIDHDIERLFFSLSADKLTKLFSRYEVSYGSKAANYAMGTYPKWRAGSVRLSGQTAERLLNLVPPLLPFDTRFELIKKLRAAKFHKMARSVQTTPERWRDDLGTVIAEVVNHGNKAMLPDDLKERVSWLADGDAATAEKLLLAADQEEAINRLAYLNAEFARLEAMLAQLGKYQTSVSHSIDLPQGTIMVFIQAPKVSMWQQVKNWLR